MGHVSSDQGIDCAWGSPIHRFPLILWEDRQETERSDLSARKFCQRSPLILWEDRQETERSDLPARKFCQRSPLILWEDRQEKGRK